MSQRCRRGVDVAREVNDTSDADEGRQQESRHVDATWDDGDEDRGRIPAINTCVQLV